MSEIAKRNSRKCSYTYAQHCNITNHFSLKLFKC